MAKFSRPARPVDSPVMDHVRTIRYPNGNQGFSSNKLGSDTVPGPMGGAPLSSNKPQEVSKKTNYPTGANPFNSFELNTPGVLGPNVYAQNAGRTADDPVPDNAPVAQTTIMTKATEAREAQESIGNIPRGVLGNG